MKILEVIHVVNQIVADGLLSVMRSAEIIEDLKAALQQFAEIASDLRK
jgi:hypothetical protein